jgi:hypothetical protein
MRTSSSLIPHKRTRFPLSAVGQFKTYCHQLHVFPGLLRSWRGGPRVGPVLRYCFPVISPALPE